MKRTPKDVLRTCGPFVMATYQLLREAGLTDRQVKALIRRTVAFAAKSTRKPRGRGRR